MNEHDKKTAIAAALAIGAVILLYLIFRGNTQTVAADTSAPSLTPNTDVPATYTNYNIPAYTPDLGNIIPPSQQSAWGQPSGELCGCGPGSQSVCSDGSPGMVGTVEQFQAMMGSYNP